MGIVSTTDKIESQKTGKIYLGKEFYKYIGKIHRNKINRCNQCGYILPKGRNKFCSLECMEEYHIICRVKRNYEKKIKKT